MGLMINIYYDNVAVVLIDSYDSIFLYRFSLYILLNTKPSTNEQYNFI